MMSTLRGSLVYTHRSALCLYRDFVQKLSIIVKKALWLLVVLNPLEFGVFSILKSI